MVLNIDNSYKNQFIEGLNKLREVSHTLNSNGYNIHDSNITSILKFDISKIITNFILMNEKQSDAKKIQKEIQILSTLLTIIRPDQDLIDGHVNKNINWSNLIDECSELIDYVENI